MKKIVILLLLLSPDYLSAQAENQEPQQKVNVAKFEKFCKKNAINYVVSPVGKKVNFSGELMSQESSRKANYMTYEVELKEQETQYFKLTDSNKILAVQSLYRLRLDYLNSKK